MKVAESGPLSGEKSENTYQKMNTMWLARVKTFSGIYTAHNALLNFPTHVGICRLYLYIMTPLHMRPQPQEQELKLKMGFNKFVFVVIVELVLLVLILCFL